MGDNSVGSVCSGYGGLDMALRIALGDIDEAWFCELEGWVADGKPSGPSLVLAERFPGVPNYGDMTAVDWARVERPRIVTAGFPCQGNSAAGRRLGRLDPRWLWPAVEQCANTLRPDEIFAENVANLLRVDGGEAFGDILADLHALGYDVRWIVVGACAAGLSHHRHRVFIRATLASKRRPRRRPDVIAEHVPALGSWWTPSGPQYGLKWPAAGSMIDGRVYADEPVPCGAPPRRAPKLRPSPMARDGDGRGEGDAEYWRHRQEEEGRTNGIPLGAVVGLLSTPRANERHARGSSPEAAARMAAKRRNLQDVAVLLPTPRARDWKGAETAATRAERIERGTAHAGYDLPTALALLPSGATIAERFAEYAAAVMRHVETTGVMPPEPTEPNKNGQPRLAPEFSEWMMTLPAGWVTDVLDRVPALKAVGNGVAPVQGALAYRLLAGLPLALSEVA